MGDRSLPILPTTSYICTLAPSIIDLANRSNSTRWGSVRAGNNAINSNGNSSPRVPHWTPRPLESSFFAGISVVVRVQYRPLQKPQGLPCFPWGFFVFWGERLLPPSCQEWTDFDPFGHHLVQAFVQANLPPNWVSNPQSEKTVGFDGLSRIQ